MAVTALQTKRISDAEWQTRVDLAACYRLVDLYGMTDLHLNHISRGCRAAMITTCSTRSA